MASNKWMEQCNYLCKKEIMETLVRFLHLIKLQVKFSMKIYRDGNAKMHSNKVRGGINNPILTFFFSNVTAT